MKPLTPYEDFLKQFEDDPEKFRADRAEDQLYHLSKAVLQLEKFSNKVSGWDFDALFGQQLGEHLWSKFASDHNRNMLRFLTSLTVEYRFFILHHINTVGRYS